MKYFLPLMALVLMAAGPSTQSLDDVVTISRTGDGRYYVTCVDTSVEIVEKEDILADNVCPHVPHQEVATDYLILLDHSGSMDGVHPVARKALISVVDEIISSGQADFRVAVGMVDGFLAGDQFADFYRRAKDIIYRGEPRVNKGFLRSDENGQQVFGMAFPPALLKAQLGNVFDTEYSKDETYGDERPLMSIVELLSLPQNEAFLRENTKLEVIVITDSDDFSHPGERYIGDNTSEELFTLEELKTQIDQVAGLVHDMSRFSVSTVGVFDQECKDAVNPSEVFQEPGFAERLQEFTRMTGGTLRSLCDFAVDEPQVGRTGKREVLL